MSRNPNPSLEGQKRSRAKRRAKHPWVKCQSGKLGFHTLPEIQLAANTSGLDYYNCQGCGDYHLFTPRSKKARR